MKASNIIAVILSVLETYIFIGIFYAWPDINKLFKDEGVFSSKCTEMDIDVSTTFLPISPEIPTTENAIITDISTSSSQFVDTTSSIRKTEWDTTGTTTVFETFHEVITESISETTDAPTIPVETTDTAPASTTDEIMEDGIYIDTGTSVEEDLTEMPYISVTTAETFTTVVQSVSETTTGTTSTTTSPIGTDEIVQSITTESGGIAAETTGDVTVSTTFSFDEFGENVTSVPRLRRDAPFYFSAKSRVKKESRAIKPVRAGNKTFITCTAQDEEFERVFQLGYTVGMILSFPVGLILDL